MSWKIALYGAEEAPKIKIIVINAIFVTMLLGGYGWWADFVPSSEWSEIGFNLALAATAILTPIYYLALLTGRTKFQPKTSTPVKILAVFLLPALIFIFPLLAITHGLGDIATQIFGHEAELTVELSKEQRQSRKSCNYRLEGYAIEKAQPDHICISEKEFNTLPRTGEYILHTKQTQLGVHIKSFSPAINR
ncbi:hypothetical protein IB229_04105 [Pseudomonas sp. PDM14]|uniref:hypothetical protein n=1 Tax=Pseudomonas sp. PDM14 TaxID=2769288 RepID=UPI0017827D99|nr:hypothetical protein [Pseudomonas sp. PDM14]MBD9482140.1 hypothetical protein [Pseudomonas sp. PDM14]